MKHVPTLIIVSLAVIVTAQNWSAADPRGTPPRTVPVNVMEVMQPSRMVAVSLTDLVNGAVVQAPIDLLEGQVFVLTSASVWSQEGPIAESTIRTGVSIVDNLQGFGNRPATHSCYPTGIRFPRAANGQADLFMDIKAGTGTAGPDLAAVSLQGYITADS